MTSIQPLPGVLTTTCSWVKQCPQITCSFLGLAGAVIHQRAMSTTTIHIHWVRDSTFRLFAGSFKVYVFFVRSHSARALHARFPEWYA